MDALGALSELSVGLSLGALSGLSLRAVAQASLSGLSRIPSLGSLRALAQGSLSRLSRFRAVSRVLS